MEITRGFGGIGSRGSNSTLTTSRPPTALLDTFDYFVLVYMPLICAIGTLSNVLLIVVFTRGQKKVRNPNIIMFIAIAIADVVVVAVGLCSQVCRIWLKWTARVEYANRSSRHAIRTMRSELHPVYVAFATTSFLLEPACSEFSIWSECFLSCARFAAICWPHKLRTWLHCRGTVITLVILACSALFLRLPLYVAHLITPRSAIAEKVEATDAFFLLFLRFLVPVLVLAVTTHGILLGLRRSRQFGASSSTFNLTRRIPTSASASGMSCVHAPATHRLLTPTQEEKRDETEPHKNGTVKFDTREARRNLKKNNHHPVSNPMTQQITTQSDDSANANGQVSLVRVTFVLVGKNVSYFLFASTYIILDLLQTFSLIHITAPLKNLYTYAYMLSYIHHITSFFICLAGGKAFRRETARIFERCTSCCRKRFVPHSIGKSFDDRSSFPTTAEITAL